MHAPHINQRYLTPLQQFQQARDSQRSSNINALINAIGQYVVDNKGVLPASITTDKKDIGDAGADLCADLVPKYLPALPTDPSSTHKGASLKETNCTTYDSDYGIVKDTNGRITVSATTETPGADPIEVTR